MCQKAYCVFFLTDPMDWLTLQTSQTTRERVTHDWLQQATTIHHSPASHPTPTNYAFTHTHTHTLSLSLSSLSPCSHSHNDASTSTQKQSKPNHTTPHHTNINTHTHTDRHGQINVLSQGDCKIVTVASHVWCVARLHQYTACCCCWRVTMSRQLPRGRDNWGVEPAPYSSLPFPFPMELATEWESSS